LKTKLGLAPLLLALLIYPLAAYATPQIEIQTGVLIQSILGGGYISFDTNVTATAITYSNSLAVFSGFNKSGVEWGTVGFYCNSPGNMSITTVTRSVGINPDVIAYTVTTTAGQQVQTRVHAPDVPKTSTITGATSNTHYINGTIIIVTTGTSNVVITYALTNVDQFEEPGLILAQFLSVILIIFFIKNITEEKNLDAAKTFIWIAVMVVIVYMILKIGSNLL